LQIRNDLKDVMFANACDVTNVLVIPFERSLAAWFRPLPWQPETGDCYVFCSYGSVKFLIGSADRKRVLD
jgi:hypothetical protein